MRESEDKAKEIFSGYKDAVSRLGKPIGQNDVAMDSVKNNINFVYDTEIGTMPKKIKFMVTPASRAECRVNSISQLDHDFEVKTYVDLDWVLKEIETLLKGK